MSPKRSLVFACTDLPLQPFALALLIFVGGNANAQPRGPASMPIVDVQLGTPTYFDYGVDSWDPTWAQDDDLYAAVNDGAGFGTRGRRSLTDHVRSPIRRDSPESSIGLRRRYW